MFPGGLIRRMAGSMTRRWSTRTRVRYTPECACCGVPDEEAVRYPQGVSLCRWCHLTENEDGI